MAASVTTSEDTERPAAAAPIPPEDLDGGGKGERGGCNADDDDDEGATSDEEEDIFHSARNLAEELEAIPDESEEKTEDDGAREPGGASGPDADGRERQQPTQEEAAAVLTRPPCPRWSDALSTPSSGTGCDLLSPSLPDAPSRGGKQGRQRGGGRGHGAGLRLAAERCRLLGRTGSSCARLVRDVCALTDELLDGLAGQRSSLAAGTESTPLGIAGGCVADCLSSYLETTAESTSKIREEAARPWSENAAGLGEAGAGRLAAYRASRARCASARKDALKARRRYGDAARDAENAVRALGRAGRGRNANGSNNRRRTGTDESNRESGGEGSASDGGYENDAGASSWTDELRSYAASAGLTRQAESVIRSADDLASCLEKYEAAVSAENAAVDECQAAERRSLDELQSLEEERVLSVSRFLNAIVDGRCDALEGAAIGTPDSVPVEMIDGGELTANSDHSIPQTVSSAGGGLFMSPARRRAQSDDGPGETQEEEESRVVLAVAAFRCCKTGWKSCLLLTYLSFLHQVRDVDGRCVLICITF